MVKSKMVKTLQVWDKNQLNFADSRKKNMDEERKEHYWELGVQSGRGGARALWMKPPKKLLEL